jgi:drug/metabolite transporter (DMT)-like permease
MRLPATVVLAVAQGFAMVTLVVVVAVEGAPLGHYLLWGTAAGLVGATALICYFRALARGPMGLVAPVAATGGVVPVLAGLLFEGDRLDAARALGIALALGGATLAATTPSGPRLRDRSMVPGVRLALVAAAGFGLYYPLAAAGGRTSIVGTLLVQRIASAGVLAGVLSSRGRTAGEPFSLRALRPWTLVALLAVGLGDLGANACFVLASRHGSLAVVGTLSSLYPVMTAGLAAGLLRERLTRLQLAGAAVAFTGVLLLGG